MTNDVVSVCENPVFVIGSPRSGTSALAWSLHQHPAFWTSDETEFIAPLFDGGRTLEAAFSAGTARPRTWLNRHEVDRHEFLSFVGLGLNAMFTSRSNGKRWVDQTPGYTLMAPLLAEMWPGALFLHIVRDGRDVVHSMMNFSRSVGQSLRDSGGLPQWAQSFDEAVGTWRTFVETALDLCARFPERTLTVVNEQLVAEPACGFSKIFEFLGAPDDPSSANFFASSRINSSFAPLVWGTVGADEQGSGGAPAVHRSDPGPAWLGWTDEERELFARDAGQLLMDLGFEDE